MSAILPAGREPALIGGPIEGGHVLAANGSCGSDGLHSSIMELEVDFAQSCVLDDSRGQINLTYSQPVTVFNSASGPLSPTDMGEYFINVAQEVSNERGNGGVGTPILSRSSSNGLSYATAAASMSDFLPKVNKGMSSVSKEEPLMMKVVIGPQHFELLKLIGEGAFGKVIMVKNLLDQNLYAMKVISKKLLKKKNSISYMKSERDILTKVDHPFIVSLFFAFQTEKKIFLVMDFLGGGELFFHLKRRGLILEKEVRFYLAEMVLAIEFLHNKGIIHRDLKPENVLLRDDGHVCITDFGLGTLTKRCSVGRSISIPRSTAP